MCQIKPTETHLTDRVKGTVHPKIKNMFFLKSEVLFINLDSFGVSSSFAETRWWV